MTKATEVLFEDELLGGLLTIDSGREAERPKGSSKTPLHHPGFSVQLRFAPAP